VTSLQREHAGVPIESQGIDMHFLRQERPTSNAVERPVSTAERSPVHEILPVTLAALEHKAPCPFGPNGTMDDDGYSTARSYAEKATIERALLVTLEQRIDEAVASDLHDVVVATRAYADDLRTRIARFDELEKGL
jgi:hypothetical protein